MEIPLAELQRNLKTIRLHGMSTTLETRLIQANQGESFAEVFACLVQDEMDSRNSRLVETRFKASGLPDRPTLTALGFEWRISGDDNRNAHVEAAYRKRGEREWRKALPFLRLQPHRHFRL